MTTARSQHGFHILDVLIALALSGLVVASALPAMSAARRRMAAREEALLVRSRLEGLWLRATGGEERIYVLLRPQGYTARLGSAGGRQIDGYRLREGLRLETSLRDPLVFHSGGIARPVTLAVAGESGRCEITISLRGRMKASCPGR